MPLDRIFVALPCLLALSSPAFAGPPLKGGADCDPGPHRGGGLGAVSGGWVSYPFPYYSTIGPNGVPVMYVPPRLAVVPVAVVPVPAAPVLRGGAGVAGPWPPPEHAARRPMPEAPRAKKKSDPARAEQLLTFGDRLFRAGNYHRAAERFEQAARANPQAASPHVRLAQIALVRGQIAEAAQRYREAQTVEPGWLANAGDIQKIYAEPADFAKQIAKLESRIQAEPQDRDAWLVLGAQWYLSGRTEKAADVFLRLTDRQPDATLAAFLDASTPVKAAR